MAPGSQVRPPTSAQMAAAQPAAAGTPAETVLRLFPAAFAKLVVVRGLKTDMEYPIYEGQNFIGRHDESPVDVDITDQESDESPQSSRQHACVYYENGGLLIEDLKSVNGTFVNRVKLNPGEKSPLKNGDFIQTGTVMFRVKS
jgi:pSer/pThr/pTyr-binding forkhead associated (FHA) protein